MNFIGGISITINDGNGPSLVDGDGDSTNEIQTISKIDDTTLELSGEGGTVSIVDGDGDSTNEIQSLSMDGDQLTLSNGGGTVTLPSVKLYLPAMMTLASEEEALVTYGGGILTTGFPFFDGGLIYGFSIAFQEPVISDVELFLASHPTEKLTIVTGEEMATMRLATPLQVPAGAIVEFDSASVSNVGGRRYDRRRNRQRLLSKKSYPNYGNILLMVGLP